MDEKLHKKLNDRKEKGTFRSLSSYDGMIDFASNDYLGFSKNGIGASDLLEDGATGSRLISGNSILSEEVEAELANFFDAEAALCFNSGYNANLGIFSAIPQRGDIVLYDEFIHASARDGIRLSHAKAYPFKHNNLTDLRRLLEANRSKTTYIAIESLYSMHGDFCPLHEIIQLAEEYGVYVILDEAHSAGIYGKQGRGYANALELHVNCLIRLITFGKAFGSHGAVVLTSTSMRDYLINFSRSFIYTTALPTAAYDRMRNAIRYAELDQIRFKLQHNVAYFRRNTSSLRSISAPNSPIQFIQITNLTHLRRVELALHEVCVFAKAIYSPTVSEGGEGIRICLHSFNSEAEIDLLIRIMSSENDTCGGTIENVIH